MTTLHRPDRSATTDRLARLRGGAEPRRHNARTIAALTTNPGCDRRAVIDAAGVDKTKLATGLEFPARFGQSGFAISRGAAFEAQVKADGAAELLRLLRELLGLPVDQVAYENLESVGGNDSSELRYARTRSLLARTAATGEGVLFDHPMLRLHVAGQYVYLEPDLVAFQVGGVFHVVEVKSFPVVDDQADGEKLRGAAVQAAVYVLAMRQMFTELDLDPAAVSDRVVLVCPKDFANRPTAAFVDVRPQLSVLRRQLGRLTRIDRLLAKLPPTLTLDVSQPPAVLAGAVGVIEARYTPDCLAACELSFFCRDEARGRTASLGVSVREELGGIEDIDTALALASGDLAPRRSQAEAAILLRAAARLRAEVLGDLVEPVPADALAGVAASVAASEAS